MKDFFKMFFASLIAMVIAGGLLVFIFIAGIVAVSKSFSQKDTVVKKGDVLLIDLSKKLHEQGESNSLAVLSKDEGYVAGLYDAVKSIGAASADPHIKGILLRLAPSPNGWATLQQLRAAIGDFKKSGKFVYAYGENITQGAYFVASAGDSIYLNPVGNIDHKGFATTLAFFKGTLDKLELQPEIFYAGKFKSATEPFRAEKMSEPNREQIMAFQNGFWDQYLTATAEYTHATKETIHQWAQAGTVQFPSDAANCKLVAGLLYEDELEQRIKNKTGQQGVGKVKYVTLNDYAMSHRRDTSNSENKIAVLYAEGNIVDGEQEDEQQVASKTICAQIRKLRNNDKIKAVVLRVNSPGGSALASEVILRELDLLKKKKHLIVSMGDYAASGGYYIASHADSIFAMPNTVTGSIGVFAMMFNLDKMMKNKLGVTFDGVKNAPYADMPSAARPMTIDEQKRMQNSVDTIYSIFKNHVAVGRNLDPLFVDSIAQGRIWTGTDAQKLGLVDGMGGLQRAIASAARMANIKNYKVVTYPEPTDKLAMIMKKIKNNTDASMAIKAAIKEETGVDYGILEQLKGYRKMSGKVLVTMPFCPTIAD